MCWCQRLSTEAVALTEVQEDIEERYKEGPSSDACCSRDRPDLRTDCHLRCVECMWKTSHKLSEHNQNKMKSWEGSVYALLYV